jgi:hypothetical protein
MRSGYKDSELRGEWTPPAGLLIKTDPGVETFDYHSLKGQGLRVRARLGEDEEEWEERTSENLRIYNTARLAHNHTCTELREERERCELDELQRLEREWLSRMQSCELQRSRVLTISGTHILARS